MNPSKLADNNFMSTLLEPKMISSLKAKRNANRNMTAAGSDTYHHFLSSPTSGRRDAATPSVMEGSVIGANDSTRNQASLLQALKVVQQKHNVFSKPNPQRANTKERAPKGSLAIHANANNHTRRVGTTYSTIPANT